MVSTSSSSKKAAQGQATWQHLVRIARQEFGTQGYNQVSTEELVRLAGVTRGALYHHFRDKRDLFLAVFEQAQVEVGQRIEQAARQAPSLWESLRAGCRAFLEASADPHLQQIVMIDAPSVLSWEVWRKADAQPGNGISLLKECLAELQAQGQIKAWPQEAMAHLLSGAMNEAALWIAQAPEPARTLAEAQCALDGLLEALRA